MFFGVFLGPIFAMVLFNTVVFVLVLRVLIKHSIRKSKEAERKQQLKTTIKTMISIISIMFMFGLQWLFGALTIAEASLAFQWLFVIFSTLQGLFLFIFFCLLGKDAREEWLRVFTCGRKTKKSRGFLSSHGPSNSHTGRRTGSSYLTTSQNRNATLLRSVRALPDAGGSVEMSTTTPHQKASLRATSYSPAVQLTSISEETEFVVANSHADDTDVGDTKLSKAQSDLIDHPVPQSDLIDHPVPPYILENRCTHHYLLSDSSSNTSLDEDEHSFDNTELVEDLTQMTDYSFMSNDMSNEVDSASELSNIEFSQL